MLDNHFIDEKPRKFNYTLFYIWIAIYMIGIFFRINHWPFGSLMIVIGSSGFLSRAISGFLFYKVKNRIIFYFIIMGVLQVIRIVFGVFFRKGKPLNIDGLSIYLILLGLILMLEYLFFRINRKPSSI